MASSDSRCGPLGAVPIIFATSASGLLLVALADAFSRSGGSHGEALFWTGLLVIFIPFVLRLASSEARRSERVVLLLLLGAAFYLVKVLRDPFGFTYADESSISTTRCRSSARMTCSVPIRFSR